MEKFMNYGTPGTKDHIPFLGASKNFPEEGMLGPELQNHTRVGPRDKVGRECQEGSKKILLEA